MINKLIGRFKVKAGYHTFERSMKELKDGEIYLAESNRALEEKTNKIKQEISDNNKEISRATKLRIKLEEFLG